MVFFYIEFQFVIVHKFKDVLSSTIERLRDYRQRLCQLPMNDPAGTQEINLSTDFTKDIAKSLEYLIGVLFVPVANEQICLYPGHKILGVYDRKR